MGVSGGGSSGVGRLLMLGGIVGKSVHDLDTDLLGKGELNSLASGGSQGSDTLLESLRNNLDLWDSDTFLFGEVLAADSWERDWLVDTGLDWLRVGNLNSWLNRGNNRDIVASLLGNLLAVVVSVAVVSVSWGWLADGNHLGVALLVEGNLNSLGSGFFSLLLIRVGADLVINLLDALGTDSTGDWVALLYINNDLDSKFNWVADSLKSRGTNFGGFNNILN